MSKVRVLLAAGGAAGGFLSWKFADAAREYCGSYSAESPFDAAFLFEPVVSVAVGVFVALAVHVPAHRDTWPKRLAPFALLTVIVLGMIWVQMAWLGTPVGGTSDSGRCAVTNVPAWWPTWMPV